MAAQTQPELSQSIHLRSALNSGPNATTLAAFSPDIIPLDQVKASQAQLVSTYNDFIAHSIDLDEPSTLVYIRGKQSEPSANLAVASLRAVPNELILWPQVWETADVIGHTGLGLNSKQGWRTDSFTAVGGAPIQYSPIPILGEGHSHATLIATVGGPNETFSVSPAKNWRDLVKHVGKNTSLGFYNVQTADPASRQTKLLTKFRLLEDQASHVELFFGLEIMGIPSSGIDASLNVAGTSRDKTGFSFAIDRQALSQTGVYGKYVKSEPSANLAVASLRAVPNELILWPQVWETADVIGHTGLGLNSKQVAVGGAPIQYSPIPISGEGHSHATLIANVAGPNEAFSVPPVKNWRDLVKHVGKNTSLGFYNVQTADPASRQTKLVTKFRLLEDQAAHVELFFGLELMGIPPSGIDASLDVVGTYPDKTMFSFTIDRQPLSQPGVYGKYVKVPSGFGGNVTLEVFNDNGKVFGDYSSISLVVYAVDPAGDVLLGAEHLMFDSNPRVKKLALGYTANPPGAFYFRSALSDNGNFPRSGDASASSDIQPLGQVQDPNPAVTLGNFSVDVSTQRGVIFYIDTSNYIYLRGTTVQADSGQTRLFYIPGGLLHPSIYIQPSHVVFDVDGSGNPVTAFRRYQTATAQQVVIVQPFTLDNIALPPAGDHYCMIAECLPDGQTQWPHEKVSNFATAAEFAAWVLSEPCVCWRNITVVSNPNPDDQTLQSSFQVPPGCSATDVFQFQVQATNCPIGSSFSVTSDDPAIRFPNTPITTDPTIATSQFTGKAPGYSVQVTIHWFANGKAVKTGQSLNAVLIQIVPQLAIIAQVASAPQVEEDKAITTKGILTTYVSESYPNLVDPNATKDRRLKIGGAIRARSLGEATDDYDSSDPFIPIMKGIIIGVDRIRF